MTRGRLLVLAVVLLLVGGAYWGVRRTSDYSGESTRQVRCASNLRQIGHACHRYAEEHGGAYPTHLGLLHAAGGLPPATLVCPSTKHAPPPPTDDLTFGRTLDYVYLGTDLRADAPDVVVLLEPLSNHAAYGPANSLANVARADGSVTSLRGAEFQALVGQLQDAGRLSAAEAAAVLDVPER